MYKVFNMGHRLEIITDSFTADGIIKIANTFNIDNDDISFQKNMDLAYLNQLIAKKVDKASISGGSPTAFER